jgi:hypothetical protein
MFAVVLVSGRLGATACCDTLWNASYPETQPNEAEARAATRRQSLARLRDLGLGLGLQFWNLQKQIPSWFLLRFSTPADFGALLSPKKIATKVLTPKLSRVPQDNLTETDRVRSSEPKHVGVVYTRARIIRPLCFFLPMFSDRYCRCSSPTAIAMCKSRLESFRMEGIQK